MRWIADPEHGHEIDATDTMYPTVMEVLRSGPSRGNEAPYNRGAPFVTNYGVVVEGVARITTGEGIAASLEAGSYYSAPGVVTVQVEPNTKVVNIQRIGFRGQHAIGKLESRGRLSYIDGCSDSMLVYPPRMGDPVLNHLHFPGDILQTQHTHPSIRMGVVMAGEGVSWRGHHGQKDDLRPFMDLAQEYGLALAVAAFQAYVTTDVDSVLADTLRAQVGEEVLSLGYNDAVDMFEGIHSLNHLAAGGVFMLEESELHSFATVPGGHMEIVAYHPDSDWGPTDANHPMLNRTYINHGQ